MAGDEMLWQWPLRTKAWQWGWCQIHIIYTLQAPGKDKDEPPLMSFGVHRLPQTYYLGISSRTPLVIKEVVNLHFTNGTLAEQKYSPSSLLENKKICKKACLIFYITRGKKIIHLQSQRDVGSTTFKQNLFYPYLLKQTN